MRTASRDGPVAGGASGRRFSAAGDSARPVGGRDRPQEAETRQPRLCGTARSRYTPAEEDDAWMRTASRAWCWYMTG